MAEDAEARILIKARQDVAPAVRETQRALQQLQGSAKALGGAFAAIQIGGMFRDGGVAILQFAGRLEQAQVAFKTMTGSVDVAQGHLKQLQQFALNTPFDFPQLVEASKRLQAMGTSVKDVIPLMTTLGNITAGVGTEKLPQLVLAFGQVQAAGRLTGAELRQFTEAGVPLLGTLAEAYNTTTAKMVTLVEEGKVGADAVRFALDKLGNTKFGGLMADQSRTFLGALTNIQDSARTVTTTALEPLFEVVRAGAVDFASFLSSADAQRWATQTAGDLKGVLRELEGIKRALSDATPEAKAMGSALEGLKGAAEALAGVIVGRGLIGLLQGIGGAAVGSAGGVGLLAAALYGAGVAAADFQEKMNMLPKRGPDLPPLPAGTGFPGAPGRNDQRLTPAMRAALGGAATITPDELAKIDAAAAEASKALAELQTFEESNNTALLQLGTTIKQEVIPPLGSGIPKAGGAAKSILDQLEVSSNQLRDAMDLLGYGADEQRAVLEALGVSALDAGPILEGLGITAERLGLAFERAGLHIEGLGEKLKAAMEAEKARKEAEREAEEAARKMEAEAKRAAEELERSYKGAAEKMRDFMVNALTEGKDVAAGTADYFRDVWLNDMKDRIAAVARQIQDAMRQGMDAGAILRDNQGLFDAFKAAMKAIADQTEAPRKAAEALKEAIDEAKKASQQWLTELEAQGRAQFDQGVIGGGEKRVQEAWQRQTFGATLDEMRKAYQQAAAMQQAEDARLEARNRKRLLKAQSQQRNASENRLAAYVARVTGQGVSFNEGGQGLFGELLKAMYTMTAAAQSLQNNGVNINQRSLATHEAGGPKTSRLLQMSGAAYARG